MRKREYRSVEPKYRFGVEWNGKGRGRINDADKGIDNAR